jgi:predicted amidophosphoribosyltransferase
VIYSATAQKVLLGAKENQLKAADDLVSAALGHSLQYFLNEHRVDFLIPIPSRKSAVRRRGRQFIDDITRPASDRFRIPIANPLIHAKKVRDQSGLNIEQRWNNLQNAFVVKKDYGHLGRVVLVDDLVTTGATLSEAARALRYAGIQVIGAVTAAVAQPLR